MSLITEGFSKKQKLTVDAVASTLTDYVLVVTEAFASFDNTEFWTGDNHVASDGRDLRFSTDSGGTTEIPVHVIGIDINLETFALTTKVTLTTSVTDIYMWWGKQNAVMPAVTDPNGRNAVYSAYEAHWNLTEASSTDAVDATGNGYTGTSAGTTEPTSVDGQIWKAKYLADSGATPQRFAIVGSSIAAFEGQGTSPPTRFTVAGLFKKDRNGTFEVIVGKRATAGGVGYELSMQTSNKLGLELDTGGGGTCIVTGTTVVTDTNWHHFMFSIDSTGESNNVIMTLDGVNDIASSTPDFTGSLANAETVGLGSRRGGASEFNYKGSIEHISFVTDLQYTATWAITQYTNIFSMGTFILGGATTTYNQFPADWDLTKFITLTSNPDYIRRDFVDYIGKIDEKQPIYVSKEADFWATVGDGGGLRLATGLDGSGQLPYDMDVCEDDNEVLCSWGKFPEISLGGGDVYYLFYSADNPVGQPPADSTYGKQNVHGDVYGDCGRWHSSIQGAGVTGEFEDVSGAGNHGTGDISPIRVRGICGYGQEGNGLTKKITLTDTGFPTGADQRTMWVWIFVGDDPVEDSGFGYGQNTTGNRVCIQQRDDGAGVHFSGNFRGRQVLLTGWFLIVARVPDGLSGPLSTAFVEIIINGVQIYPINLSGLPDTLNTLLGVAYLGAAPGGAHTNKLFDEAGLTTQYLDNDWLYLDFHSMYDSDRLWGAHEPTIQDVLDAIANLLLQLEECCEEILAAIAGISVQTIPQSGILKVVEDIDKLIKRIFSDQRNQTQHIQVVHRANLDILKKLGVDVKRDALNPKGARYDGDRNQ